MNVSKFGKKIATTSGIGHLMDDLGHALAKHKDILMLGGGNPAHIPQVQQYFRTSMVKLLEDGGKFERAIGDYPSPQGDGSTRTNVSASITRRTKKRSARG